MPKMAPRQQSPDLEAQQDEELMYGNPAVNQEELKSMWPDKPVNHAKTLPFHELFTTLFNPLIENRKRPNVPRGGRAKQGPHGNNKLSPNEQRRYIIDRFMSRWRQQVGNDFYPALRLILPEKDRERAMYGLKEKAIAKLLVRLLGINPKSEAGYNLLNWKVPDNRNATRTAGDFALRCYEVLKERAAKTTLGDMRIAEVNERLDRLSLVSKENDQLKIFEEFYPEMNAEEMTWLIRIILRQMKIGAHEKTILDIWHPDGEALFNVSSDLRRICWELPDPNYRLPKEGQGITLMQCFQPQRAQFQMQSFQKMIEKVGCMGDDDVFWIEDKLDGERMQMHMQLEEDERKYPGGRRFGFWSRNGKDYTYLYGSSFGDDNSALTRFIRDGFDPQVKNIILDGEMITWDPESDAIVGFGTLKSAAIAEKNNPYSGIGHRPLFRVFDCLYLNDVDLTQWTLKDRRNALERSVRNVDRRLEIHKYEEATRQEQIETRLHEVVANSWEGLVLKNPHSVYQVSSRNYDWIKVKPEYMTEYGESLDCVVIGGYYGSGHRSGILSSFLCGLRVNHLIQKGANEMKCLSFFKVGGGFKSEDYAKIKYLTEGKWVDWDTRKPPIEYIELGGKDKQKERPDVWIKPCDSIVLQVKAASCGGSGEFATGITLRFPRFQRLREDKKWNEALSIDDFYVLKQEAEQAKDKKFKVDASRKRAKRQKQELVIMGNDATVKTPYAGPSTKVFEGLNFCVLSDMLHPTKKSKGQVEQIIKNNGGNIFQSPTAQGGNLLCIGDKNVIPVASLVKKNETNIIRPAWILDTLKQAEIDGPQRTNFLLPFEPKPVHMYHVLEEQRQDIEANVDQYKDSYARDITPQDLKRLMDDMPHLKNSDFDPTHFLTELEKRGKGLGEMPGEMFRRCVMRFVGSDVDDSLQGTNLLVAKKQVVFAGGTIVEDDEDELITHFVFVGGDSIVVKTLRQKISQRGGKIPRIVDMKWLEQSWAEKTLLDEERYVVST